MRDPLLIFGVRNPKLAFWMLLLGGSLLLVSTLRAQMSDEEKRRLFLQSREDIHPVSKPSPSVTPRQKPQPASTPRPKPKSTPVAEETEEPTATPRPTPKSTPVREEKAEPVTRSTPKSTPDPAESEEPAATPHPRPKTTPPSEDREEPKSTPRPTPKPMHPPVGKEDPDPTPHSKKTTPEPAPEKKPEPPKSSETPDFIDVPDQPVAVKKAEKASPTPESSPVGQPVPAISPAQIPQGKTPQGQALDAPILVEKSGLDEDQGIEAPPKPQFGGFFKRYRYLTPSVRKAIDQARVQRGRWKYIIVHNSGTRQGNARIFDVYHRRVRKMQNGMAYHFVIGNGNSSGNGEIEIGNRWIRQINGGHVASDYLNNISLGICLVGDLNRDKPTKDQLAALDELITYLRGRVGKIKGKQAIVKGHKEINPKPTDCPGDRFPLSWLRQRFR